MYKCPNCGSEFEGNFCPECGTRRQEDKTCPKCGSVCPSSANFCTNCGYLFNQSNAAPADKTTSTATQPQVHVYVKQQKPASPLISKIYEYLKYAPIFIFAAFSVLLFVFYCTPVAEMVLVGSMGNVYILACVSEISVIQNSMIALIILAVLYLLAAAGAVYCLIKFKNKYITIGRFAVGVMQLCGIISIVLYIVTLTIGCIACSIISDYATVGAAPILIIVFSSIFIVLSVGALITRVVLNRIFYNVVPEEERAAKDACKKHIEALPKAPVKNFAFNSLKYTPIALFSLFSLLSIAFLAASAVVSPAYELLGVEFPPESYGNVYQYACAETELRPLMIALVILMVVSLCYSLAAVFYPKKQIKEIHYFGYITVPLYIVWLVLACAVCGKISAIDDGMEEIFAGTAPTLIIVFSIIFALLAIGAYVAKYIFAKKDPALSSFERDYFEKKQQRKAEIKQRKQELAEEYKTANPAPVVVEKTTRKDFKNTAYYKAKKAQNFKITFIFWLIAIYSLVITLGYINNSIAIFSFLVFLVSIFFIIFINRRKPKSINSACKQKLFTLVYIFILLLFIFGGIIFLHTLFFIASWHEASLDLGLFQILQLLITALIPYFVARHKIKKARLSIYGENKIKGLTPLISFEELCGQLDDYKKHINDYKNYREEKAKYDYALKSYVKNNFKLYINKTNDELYSENIEQSEETAQADIDN